jgi:hypothetical protein
MFKTNQPKETMKQINDKMDQAIINDDFDQIENIALDPNHALVKTTQYNMFTDQVSFVNRWVDISNVNKEYFDDLSSDCQDYVMSLDKYKDMDYDTMVGLYDEPIEQKNNKELELFRKQINESNKKSA